MNSRILQTGRAGLDSIQNKMDTVAHNIANAQTNGYKTMEVQFEDLVYDRLGNKGTPITRKAAGKPVQIGTGSRVKTIQHRFDNGRLFWSGRGKRRDSPDKGWRLFRGWQWTIGGWFRTPCADGSLYPADPMAGERRHYR